MARALAPFALLAALVFTASCATLGGASFADVRKNVDTAQEALTAGCDEAFDHFEFTAFLGQPVPDGLQKSVARGCKEAGLGLEDAQVALDAAEAGLADGAASKALAEAAISAARRAVVRAATAASVKE